MTPLRQDDALFADLRRVRPPLRWIFVAARSVFAFCGVVGAVTFVLHAILFYTAMRYASPTPTPDQPCRIIEHAESRYVTPRMHACLKSLAIPGFLGLCIAIPGELGLRFVLRRLDPRD